MSVYEYCGHSHPPSNISSLLLRDNVALYFPISLRLYVAVIHLSHGINNMWHSWEEVLSARVSLTSFPPTPLCYSEELLAPRAWIQSKDDAQQSSQWALASI